MAQHLNLFDAALRPRRERLTAASLVVLLLVAAVSIVAAAAWERGQAQRQRQAARDAERELDGLRRSVAAAATNAGTRDAQRAAIERLRRFESDQRRVEAALQDGLAHDAPGYAAYLLALSRQATPNLWITSFAVGADGQSVEIAGRMTDPALLAGYLRRLNAEPLFRGRAFERFSLKAAAPPNGSPDAPPPWTEFALRGQAAAEGSR